ncbi:MAG: transposase [Candidatus Micrarchaeia archaeon]
MAYLYDLSICVFFNNFILHIALDPRHKKYAFIIHFFESIKYIPDQRLKCIVSRDLDQNPSNIYEQYKSRKEVEQVFGTMKGDLKSNKTYLRDNEKVKGYFFIVFLALRIRFRILKMLNDHDLLEKISVNKFIFELSKMERIVEKGGVEYFAVVPKKVEKIVDLFKNILFMG